MACSSRPSREVPNGDRNQANDATTSILSIATADQTPPKVHAEDRDSSWWLGGDNSPFLPLSRPIRLKLVQQNWYASLSIPSVPTQFGARGPVSGEFSHHQDTKAPSKGTLSGSGFLDVSWWLGGNNFPFSSRAPSRCSIQSRPDFVSHANSPDRAGETTCPVPRPELTAGKACPTINPVPMFVSRPPEGGPAQSPGFSR